MSKKNKPRTRVVSDGRTVHRITVAAPVIVPTRRLYIAYGSNLCHKQMRQRAPGARPAGKLILDHARLVFRGVADVVPDIGHMVPVGLWSITERDEANLDRWEGVAGGSYVKREIDIGDGETAYMYFMAKDDGVYPPTERYVATMRQGYRDFGLDPAFIDVAILRSYDEKNPTDRTRARRARQKAMGAVKLVPIPDDVAMWRLDAIERNRTRH